MSVDFYSYALTLLYISMLSITFAKIRKNAVSTKLFSTYFSPQKSPFSISFYSKKRDVTYLYFIFLPVETRAMIFFLHEKNENLNSFGSNLPHNAYMVDFFIRKEKPQSSIYLILGMLSPGEHAELYRLKILAV